MTQSSAEWKKKLREVDHEILEILRLEVLRMEIIEVAGICTPIINFQLPSS